MADDTDQLVISISADTSQIDRAINRLLGTVNSSTRGIETAFTRTGNAMDGVGISATKLQQQLNALTGVNTSMKSRADDVAAYGAALDDLRAKYNPLFALSKQYETELEGINNAAKVGAISSAEQAAAIDDLNDRYTTAQTGAKGLASAHGGLSAQAQAAQHSVRSFIEQIALGIPPTQALTGQMNHLTFAASGEGGLSGAFKDAAKPLAGLLSTSVLTFAGITAAIGAATLAVHSYLSAQQKVQASVLGAGHASGATQDSINNTADQGSSFGLSVSGARDLAAALASTGKVANDNILPIVKMGHDVSLAFGTDAAGAAKILADAFSDPVKGADDLNQRLGFLDAATKQNITNLVAQNNQYGAQRALIDAMKGSLAEFGKQQDDTAKGWTVIGNAASNAWNAVGKGVATALGMGQSLEDRLAAAKQKLEDLKASGGASIDVDSNGFTTTNDGGTAAIEAQQKAVDQLTATIQRNAQATALAQAAQQSFAQASTIRNLTPEIAQQEALNNQLKVLQGLMDQLSNSEAAGETLKQLGFSFEQVTTSIKKAQTAVISFKSDYQQALDSQKIQLQSITAFSPSAKGDVAYLETFNASLKQYNDITKAAALAEGARAIAIKQSTTALSEQARAQVLASKQSIDSAQLDIALVGKSIEQQTLLRANLASRQQLEQTAAQNRVAFNEREYKQLVKNNEEAGVSAVFILKQSRSIHLLADSASYLPSGILVSNNVTKVVPFPQCSYAIAHIGPCNFLGMLDELPALFGTLDDLVEAGEQWVSKRWHTFAHAAANDDATGAIYAAGLLKSGRPAAFYMSLWTDNSTDFVEIAKTASAEIVATEVAGRSRFVECPLAITGNPFPPARSVLASGFRVQDDPNRYVPDVDLLHIMELARRECLFLGTSRIGGKAVLTSVEQSGVRQRVVRTWDGDRVGEKIVAHGHGPA